MIKNLIYYYKLFLNIFNAEVNEVKLCFFVLILLIVWIYKSSNSETVFALELPIPNDNQIRTIIKKETKNIFNADDNAESNIHNKGKLSDHSSDWIDLTNKGKTSNGEPSTDMLQLIILKMTIF